MSIARVDGTVVLTLRGVVDEAGGRSLEHLLEDLVDGQGNRHLTVDLAGVETIDRSVLALLVSVAGRALRHGGHLVLRQPSGAVVEVIERARLTDALEVVD